MNFSVKENYAILNVGDKIYLVNLQYDNIVMTYYVRKKRYCFNERTGIDEEQLRYFENICLKYTNETNEEK